MKGKFIHNNKDIAHVQFVVKVINPLNVVKWLTIVLVVFNLIACSSEKKEVTPVVSDIEEWVFAPGIIEWDDQYNIAAQTDGILMDFDTEVGDSLKKGEVLGMIDNQTNTINTLTAREQLEIANQNLTVNSPALKQLSTSIKTAEAKYQFEKAQAERYANLYKNENITKVEYENMVLSADNSLLNLNALKEQYQLILQQAKQQNVQALSVYRNSKVSESFNQLIANKQGIVVKKFKSSGDFVRRGDVVATAADIEKTEVILNIDESNIGKIKIGQKAEIKLNSIPDSVFGGKVTEIIKTFDEQSQSFICKVSFDEKLPVEFNIFGTPLECNILTGQKSNVILIPREYLGKGNTVKIKGRKEPVVIKTGIKSTDYVEVKAGVSAKDILLPMNP